MVFLSINERLHKAKGVNNHTFNNHTLVCSAKTVATKVGVCGNNSWGLWQQQWQQQLGFAATTVATTVGVCGNKSWGLEGYHPNLLT